MNKKQRKDVFQEVTDTVLAFLKEGQKKQWHRPWKQLFRSTGSQVSIASRPYTGLNQILLMMAKNRNKFASNQWATYKAWSEKGYQVQKGEQGTDVTGWFPSQYQVKNSEGKIIIDPVTKKPKQNTVLSFKSWKVFNGSQVAGSDGKPFQSRNESTPVLELPLKWSDEGNHIAKLNSMINRHSVDIRTGGDKAFYSAVGDGFIRMPEKGQFESMEAYYGTLTHEMIHWTGHDIRTGRHTKIKESKKDFNNNDYAFEELVAEIGSCFFDKYLNIENEKEVENHFAYLQSWIAGLENNPYMIERASQMAHKAVDYLLEDKTAEAELVEVERELASV